MTSVDIESLLESKGYKRLEKRKIVIGGNKIEFKPDELKRNISIDGKIRTVSYTAEPFIGSLISCFNGEITPTNSGDIASLHAYIKKCIEERSLPIAFFYGKNIFIKKGLPAYSG